MFAKKNLLIAAGLFFLIAIVVGGIFYPQKKDSSDKSASSKAKTVEVKITDKERNDYQLKTNFIDEFGSTPFNTYTDGAILFDQETGEILYSKTPDFKAPTASISKIMTAVIVLENADFNQEIKISKTAADQIPNSMDLVEGESLTIKNLMYGMMMLSANDAAWALAEGTLGFDRFIKAMNEKAEWLELKNTTFTNPAGFDDPNHISSAYDLGIITRYALKKHPQILDYMGNKEINIEKTNKNEAHYIYHVSGLIKSYPGMDGAKTGYTWEAGHTFIGTAQREGKRLVVVVLNSQSPNSDITELFNYGFRNIGRLKK